MNKVFNSKWFSVGFGITLGVLNQWNLVADGNPLYGWILGAIIGLIFGAIFLVLRKMCVNRESKFNFIELAACTVSASIASFIMHFIL